MAKPLSFFELHPVHHTIKVRQRRVTGLAFLDVSFFQVWEGRVFDIEHFPVGVPLELRLLVQNQLLHAPISGFRGVHFVFRGARELMSSGKLAELASGPANHTEDFAVERNFEDSSWES